MDSKWRLNTRVNACKIIFFASFAVVFGSYFWIFGFNNLGEINGLSDSADRWGQFGDYVGGILNPIIAALAFYLLAMTVLMQRDELQAAKDALASSAESQEKQAHHMADVVVLNALSAQLESINIDISSLRSDQISLEKSSDIDLGDLGNGNFDSGRRQRMLSDVSSKIAELTATRDRIINAIKSRHPSANADI